MSRPLDDELSRRQVLRLAALAPLVPLALNDANGNQLPPAGADRGAARRSGPAVAAEPSEPAAPSVPAVPGRPTLRIAKYAHFLPAFDVWFEKDLAQPWGERHGIEVHVDHIPVEDIAALAAAEAAARQGHDLIMFPWPPAQFGALAIDHAEIYQAVSFRHGSIDRLAHKSTFDPRAKRYFAFADSYMPAPLHYFADQWSAVDMRLGPVHYGGLHSGGQRLRAKLGVPAGLALTPTLEGNITLHTLLLGFGVTVFDSGGHVLLGKGARAIGAVKYVKTLIEDAGAAEQLAWGAGAAARAMVARKTSCAISGISLLRTAEREDPDAAGRMRICPPLLGIGGVAAVPHVTNCSMVWSFAANQAAAKSFLSDLIDSSKAIYDQTQGCHFPSFQKTVPDLIVRLENDPHGEPPYKYKELKDALHWTANLGYPGFTTPAAMEAFNAFVIPRMFLAAAKGEATPEDAVWAADAELQRIADKWKPA